MTKDTETTTEDALLGCIFALLLLLIAPFSSIWRGYVFSVLWRWFIVSTFHAPPLGMAASIGLTYVVGLLTFHFRPTKKDERPAAEKFFEAIVFSALGPALSLGFGAVVAHWM